MKRKIPIWTKEQKEKFEKKVREKDFPINKHLAEVPWASQGFDRDGVEFISDPRDV